ncbi:MAG: response regulator [Armatimonadetes bacterium]|nr:response regulator [Armatimonadota bacterium]
MPAAAEQAPPPPESAARGARILLVEDEPGLRALARRVLETYGYQVVMAADAEEALVAAASEPAFDLLLTDVVMPGLNGRELAERLCSRFADLRVLYMSGYAESTIAKEGLLPGGVVLLPKPFGIGDLVRMVRHVLDSEGPSRP